MPILLRIQGTRHLRLLALVAIGKLSEAEAKGVIKMENQKSLLSEQEWQHVITLLSATEMSSRYSSRYVALSSAAMMELDKINKKVLDEEEKIQKAKAEEKAKEDAKKAADAKAARDKARQEREEQRSQPATPRVS